MKDRLEPSAGNSDKQNGTPESTLHQEMAQMAVRGAQESRHGDGVPLETRRVAGAGPGYDFDAEPEPEEPSAGLPFDPSRIIDALVRSWFLWITAGLICAAGVIFLYLSKPHTAASMQLVRRDAPMLFRASDAGEAYKPQQLSDQTITSLARSPELFQRISARTNPRIPVGKLVPVLFAAPERDTELVILNYRGPHSPRVAVQLLNIYAEELVSFTQEMQTREGQETAKYLGEKLAMVETNLAVVQAEMAKIPPDMKFTDPDKQVETYLVQLSELDMKYELARIDIQVNDPLAEKLQTARDELAALLVRYTEAHPMVQDQQAKVAALERQLAASTNHVSGGQPKMAAVGTAGSRSRLAAQQLEEIKALRQRIQDKLNGLSQKNVGYAVVKNRYHSLETIKTMLLSRQHEAELFTQNALGYYRIAEPASLSRASDAINWRKLIMFAIAAGLFGVAGTAGAVAVKEILDSHIKTAGDLERATGVPTLAGLGDINKMSTAAQEAWAFRTWTILKGKLSQDQNRALVCGVISARHGEGRSTWIKLLAKTAHQRGLRVLVAATRPSPEPPLHPHERSEANGSALETTKNVVAFPFQAVQHLSDPKSHAIVHIPLPGWVWNLERRQQWQTALEEWMNIENLVFLVELPPASEPEAILLAEKLPRLIWLCESGTPKVMETREHIETLRHAGCNLVGAVLNREPWSFFKRHLARWVGAAAILLAANTQLWAQATDLGETGTATASSNAVTAIPVRPVSPNSNQRPEWQRHMTLGPGDVLDLSYFGETNLTKYGVVVGMDGRVGYLQAQNVVAAGLTIDQLREALNKELSKYYRSPRVIVTPVAYRSKKYFITGRVVAKGAYILDRPISVLEAVSRARGLETGLAERNIIDLADLKRSFVLRQGTRVDVDLERLFQQGDFSQNIQLEPDDFVYFAPATLKEVYVVGEVRAPGVVPLIDDTSLMRIIADRGGFTDHAYKRRVLVVRGSLNKPQTFAVNTWAVLDARQTDFKLQPRDIIYVSRRPFLRAEELLDVAVTSFLQSATASWAGVNIGPIITSPFLPKL